MPRFLALGVGSNLMEQNHRVFRCLTEPMRRLPAGIGLLTVLQPLFIVLEPSLQKNEALDRKSTRLNSSHGYISYAVFCLKNKKTQGITTATAALHPPLPQLHTHNATFVDSRASPRLSHAPRTRPFPLSMLA